MRRMKPLVLIALALCFSAIASLVMAGRVDLMFSLLLVPVAANFICAARGSRRRSFAERGRATVFHKAGRFQTGSSVGVARAIRLMSGWHT